MFPPFNLKSLDVFLHYYQMPAAVWNEVINSFESSTWTYPLCFESLHFTYLHSEGLVLKGKGKLLSRVGLFATPRPAAYQAPPNLVGIFQARVLEWGAIAFSEVVLNYSLSFILVPGAVFT